MGFEFFSVRRRRNTGGTKRDVTEGDDGARRLRRDGPSALQRQVTSGVATKSGNDVGNRPRHGGHETGRDGGSRRALQRNRATTSATDPGTGGHETGRHGGGRRGTTFVSGRPVGSPKAGNVGRCNEIGQRRRRPAPTRGARNGTSRNGTTVHVGRCNEIGQRRR